MTCKKQTYQNILILLLYFFLRALRGYNILFFGCIGYFFEKNHDNNFINLKKTMPAKAKKSQRWEFLTTFSQEIREFSQTMITNSQTMKTFSHNNESKKNGKSGKNNTVTLMIFLILIYYFLIIILRSFDD